MNPMRDLEYPFALGILEMSPIDVVLKKDIPAEHALDKDDVIDPPDRGKTVDPRDTPIHASDDEVGVDVN